MHLSKFYISAEATGKLRVLRQRAMVTPNLLCRMAMGLSFELGPIGPVVVTTEDGQEFNAYTLFGPDQPIYTSMLKVLETGDGAEEIEDGQLLHRLKAHIDRGIGQLAVRIKSPSDTARILGQELV